MRSVLWRKTASLGQISKVGIVLVTPLVLYDSLFSRTEV